MVTDYSSASQPLRLAEHILNLEDHYDCTFHLGRKFNLTLQLRIQKIFLQKISLFCILCVCKFMFKASATRSKHSKIQKYKHLNKSKLQQLAYVTYDRFYWDKLMTYLTLFLTNLGNNWQILTLI